MIESSHRRLLGAFVVAAALAMGGPAFAAGPSAEMMAETCAGCHGTDGSSHGPVTPSIASISVDYFVLSMKDYKSGRRPATVMDRIAKGYSDEDFVAMAKYFQTKPFVRFKQATDPAKVKAGKALAKKYCESCHEDEGRVAEGVGVLAGQWLPYMQNSMVDFLAGKRDTERRQKLKFDQVVQEKGADAFQDILHYYASVK